MEFQNKNKGEWGELYAGLHVLFTGQGVEEDGSVKITEELIRRECGKEKRYIRKDGNILFQGQIIKDVPTLNLLLPDMFNEIRTGRGSFSCPTIEKVMQILGIERVKCTFSNKDDFRIKFKGYVERGYNVKAEFAGCASIINASKGSNFTFEVVNCPLSDAELNSLIKPKKIVQTIYACGGYLIFRKCSGKYKMQLNSDGTDILSLLLVEYFKTPKRYEIPYLVNQILASKEEIKKICKSPVLDYSKETWVDMVGHILQDFTTHKVPLSIRKRDSQTPSGGIITVKNDGSIILKSDSSKNDAGNYLYRWAKIDTGDTGRHKFGKVCLEPEGYRSIKLAVNIKMNKKEYTDK